MRTVDPGEVDPFVRQYIMGDPSQATIHKRNVSEIRRRKRAAMQQNNQTMRHSPEGGDLRQFKQGRPIIVERKVNNFY